MKTNELTGAALDWAVAKCEGYATISYPILAQVWVEKLNERGVMDHRPLSSLRYSTNWAQGGPIIERESLSIVHQIDGTWSGYTPSKTAFHASSPLVAAMRAYVAGRAGNTIDIPEELL